MMYNNLNLDHVNIIAYTKYLVIFGQFVLKILSENEKVKSITGHNSVTNLQKMINNNPSLHLVYINVHTKFGQILSI